MKERATELINPIKGTMRCKVCGMSFPANIKVETDSEGKKTDHYDECPNGCTLLNNKE